MYQQHSTLSRPDGRTIISVACIDCKERKEFEVSTAAYDRWQQGELIQRSLTEVPETERELLISGTCGACFDKLFAGDKDE